ncbi:vitamin-D-receptor interacting mediator subunit 4-domain-containing protein [Rhypophila decipiens]|uniref:Mediator of RNA polymerase II transcription subunit 4 n=1 Tax=Rhypophila decipiens TaxID=261697 RepID=A0AAN6Y9Q0_9PEZI|nr:vitamin-D-receptor interacting mediator subunit 4-domain-containing protein [Rhypophila decipiens]
MDKYLDARFERVEKALAVLIDSITKYNPSEKLADDLAVADRELAQGLKDLERHQNNYARIQQLRNESAALDSQIKDTMGALWSVRKEVKNTQTTNYPPTGPRYNFTTVELLDYARRISQNTLPPPGVTNGVDLSSSAAATPAAADNPEATTTAGQTPSASFNGGTTTTVGTPAAPTPGPTDQSISQPGQPQQSQSQPGATSLPENLKPYIDRLHGAVFYPWPTEETIRRGALAGIQQLVDEGINPLGYDPEEEIRKREQEEQARKEADELARREREEAERMMREERERMARDRERARQEAERRGSVIGGGVGIMPGAGGSTSPAVERGAKKQFLFLGGDDEDDDDDE